MKNRPTKRYMNTGAPVLTLTSAYLTAILSAGCVLAAIALFSGAELYRELAQQIFHCSFRVTALGFIAAVVMDILMRNADEDNI